MNCHDRVGRGRHWIHNSPRRADRARDDRLARPQRTESSPQTTRGQDAPRTTAASRSVSPTERHRARTLVRTQSWARFVDDTHHLGRNVTTGRTISAREMPPCWNVLANLR